jgi:uncharacterized protein (DUF1015 family)
MPDEAGADLDAGYLQEQLLDPVLGIADPRRSPRIEFFGGEKSIGQMVRRVDRGEASVAFSMYPVTVDQMMAVADRDDVMPPKSTWFEPKLRSGMLVHTF